MTKTMAAALCAMILTTGANAQTYYARHKLSISNENAQAPVTPPAPSVAGWVEGTWSAWSGGDCSDTSIRTRTVSCAKDGVVQADAACSGTKPATSEGPVGRYDSCQYSWKNGFLNNVGTQAYCVGGAKAYNVLTSCFKKGDYNFATRAADSACTGLAKPASRQVAFPCTNIGPRYLVDRLGGSPGSSNMKVRYVSGILTAAQAKTMAVQICNERSAERYSTTERYAEDCHFRSFSTSVANNQTAVEAGIYDERLATSALPTGGDWKSFITGQTQFPPVNTIRVTRPVEFPDDYTAPCGSTTSTPVYYTTC